MTEKIKTNLIDTPDEVEVDYWTGEWINEEDIIKNLVDESVVLTIANKAIRDRMLSISESAKAIKNTNRELKEKIYELENKNKELQEQLDNTNKIIHQKALEILKDVEREKYGYAVGDKLYKVAEHHHYEEEPCPVCKGKREYEVNGIKLKCSYCNIDGIHRFMVKDPYKIIEVEIIHNGVRIEKSTDDGYIRECNGNAVYTYTNEKKEKFVDCINPILENIEKFFKTREEAEKWIKENS